MPDAAPAKRVKVLEALRLAEGYLAKYGVESARLSAEHLLARRMACSRLDLYLAFDREVEESVLGGFREDLKLRSTHYPLQYILGEIEFLSLAFRIREGVFIPRPETELLVERIEELLGDASELSFVEFGVGSGVIAGSLAARHPGWRGVAVDVSPEAIALARENFAALGVGERIATLVADGLGALEGARRHDLLVANPPYVPSGVIPSLEDEVARFESRAALDGGTAGVDHYPALAREALRLLRPGGLAAFEIGDGQGAEVQRICAEEGLVRAAMKRDYNGFDRMVTAFAPDAEEGSDG